MGNEPWKYTLKLLEMGNNVIGKWRDLLKLGGYEPPKINGWIILRYRLLSRMWRHILSAASLKRSSRLKVLEFGCGGGAQIIPLLVNGWDVTGVDCSREVIRRAQEHVRRLRAACRTQGEIRLLNEDFIKHIPSRGQYDMTVAFGVLEHFLTANERLRYLKKMFEFTKPGGIVVSAVPNGFHPYRKAQRRYGWGGYVVPEIDYSPKQLEKEMRKCGAKNVRILFNNMYGYLRIIPGNIVMRVLRAIAWMVAQAPVSRFLSLTSMSRHAYWLIAIGRKDA